MNTYYFTIFEHKTIKNQQNNFIKIVWKPLNKLYSKAKTLSKHNNCMQVHGDQLDKNEIDHLRLFFENH